jgi:predicted dehydrogenase
VLVEKPLAPSQGEAARILAAAHEHGRRVHVACCLRFDPGLLWLASELPQVGRLRLADVECLSWLPAWRPGRDPAQTYAARPGEGGVLLDLIHEIDYTAWLLGPHGSVQATLSNQGVVGLPAAIDETALLSLRSAGDLPVTMRLSYAIQPASRRLRIFGERGALEWDFLARRARRLQVSGAEAATFAWPDPAQMYVAQARAWVASLQGQAAPALADGAQGLHAVAVCDAARRASERGGWEPIR